MVDEIYEVNNQEEEKEDEFVQAKMYFTREKEENNHLAERMGLEGEALDYFKYAFSEVECEIKVNTETGEAELLKVDGKELS
jgi:hypothetical protein